MKSFLILTAGFGEGHNAAARNLREAILAESPDARVVVSDVFLEAYGWVNRLAQKGYVAMINHAPAAWQGLFVLLDRTRLVEQHMIFYRAAERRLEQLIAEIQPAVVISVYPGCNHLLDHFYRRRLKRPFQTVTIITDSITINSVWYRAHSDYFVVTNEPTAEVIRQAGVPEKKIQVLGFPVPGIFASLQPDRPAPAPDGRWRVLYVINSNRGLAPQIVRRLLEIPKVALSVTVGRDQTLGEQISAVASSMVRPLDLYGWTSEMPRLMAENHLLISKAGGATVQETLAAKTPMLVTQIVPGQEEGNARLLLDNGAGALAVTPEAIAENVRLAFRSDAQIWQGWLKAVESLSHPDGAAQNARFILGLAEN